MKNKAVIFDLDGTLAYTLEDIADSMNRVLNDHGFQEHDYETYKGFVGHGIRNLVYRAIPPEKRIDKLIDQCHIEMIDIYRENCLVKSRLYDGITELVNSLFEKGIKLAIFSNKAHELTVKVVDGLFGPGKFNFILGSGPDLPSKPEPDGALQIAKEIGVDPVEMAYVGDSGTDMLTAKRAGMFAIGVTWGYRDKDDLIKNGADLIIDTPLEIINIISE